MTALLVVLGAAVGAPLRYALTRHDGEFPGRMLAVNAAGSLLFGLFAALSLDDAWWALLGTGFCGAFTSFASFALQAVTRPAPTATTYVVATTVLSVAACTLGWVGGSGLG